MNRKLIHMKCLGFVLLVIFSSYPVSSYTQGPPITTDTPIMLGLEGGGFRTFTKFIRKAKLLESGKEINDEMNRRVTVRVTPLVMPYNFLSDRFQLGLIVPIMGIDLRSGDKNGTSSGVGDSRIFAKYLLYQLDRKKETVRVASKAGIKLPSGDEKKSPALGSGSTDYFLSTVFGWIKGRMGFYLEGILNLNTSKNQTDFGNSFAYNLAIGYRLLPTVYEIYPSPQVNGFIEVNGTTANKNKIAGQPVDSSGGTTVFLSPGLQYVGGRRWLIEATFQYPIVNELNGVQLGTDWTFSLGTRILIF